MSVVMSSISHRTVDCNIRHYDHEGLRWVQKPITVLVPYEDLRGQNVVLWQSTVLCEMLDITTDDNSYISLQNKHLAQMMEYAFINAWAYYIRLPQQCVYFSGQ